MLKDPSKLNEMQRYLLEEEIENYERKRLDRREFLRRASAIVGTTAATAILAACKSEPMAEDKDLSSAADLSTGGGADLGSGADLQGQVGVPEDDPAILVSNIEIPHKNGDYKLLGYLVTPKVVPANAAGVLLIHENRAMTPYIKDVVRRWAKAGYVTLGVDLLSRAGGTQAFPDEAMRPGALSQITPEQTVADLAAGLDYLKGRADVKDDRLAVTGFCYGGGYTWRMATQRQDLKAAVPFYGPNPPLADVAKIKAACLGIYGALDTRITSTVPMLEEELKKAGITYEMKIYEGADHAFHNDTGARYNAMAAADAWQRALAWVGKYV